ncbi:bifunctional (p)ppGpp synthetase/guanosine-3',5'-bis(diphosphate) 3'-pyrophosphohydrolase [Candidatus Woesearchaeota archaeon]|nr:bifunctional (p)ppGpp synthetase/guanosine-3',5'-bis(diphosphate) 3'-pyrophosphohydrolase [Candidatus Woesearchaeota archaeon]
MNNPLSQVYPEALVFADLFSDQECELIIKALSFAQHHHRNQRRVAGPPFIVHPIATAQLLMDQFNADCGVTMAGLLHDTVEDTEATLEEVEERFGPAVMFLVDGATDVGRGDGNEKIENRAERVEATHKKVKKYAEKDPNVVLIKIADRWHNLMTCQALRKKSQCRMAQEALDFHIPLCREKGFNEQADMIEELARNILKGD